jgi:hypothetical protein
MKYGYSVLMGELVSACECGYDDCKQFQIVCPECYEPVFKVHRQADNVNFLSHYKAENKSFEQCELRVAMYNSEKVSAANKVVRAQSLSLFLQQFQSQLRAMRWYPGQSSVMKNMITKNLLFKEYFYSLIKALDNRNSKQWIISSFEMALHDFDGVIDPKTRKALAIQERIAADMFLLLVTPKERQNMRELAALALLMMVNKYISNTGANFNDAIDGHLGSRAQYEALLSACSHSKRQRDFDHFYSRFVATNVEEAKALDEFSIGMHSLIALILVNIPYQSMLEHRQGEPWDSTLVMDSLSLTTNPYAENRTPTVN